MAVADIANMCLQADSENKVLPSRQIATKAFDAISTSSNGIRTERHVKTGFVGGLFKPLWTRGYFGGDFAESSQRTGSIHSMYQSLSIRKPSK